MNRDLISRINAIDPDAAAWLENNEGRLTNPDALSLGRMMEWRATPQGYKYWESIDNHLIKAKKSTTGSDHPFNIKDENNVSYRAHNFTKAEIKHMIQLYRAKSLNIGYSASLKMSFIASYIKIGCQEFSVAEIEAFIKEYEDLNKKTYVGIGDHVFIDKVDYIVASVSMDQAILISIKDGTRWNNPKDAPNKRNIPLDIFFSNMNEHLVRVEKRS